VRGSILAITFATRVHFAPCFELKIPCVPFNKPNFRYIYFFIYDNFSFIVYEVIIEPDLARFLAAYLFYSVFHFIRVIRVLLVLVKTY